MKLPSWLRPEPRPVIDPGPPEFVWVWKDEDVPRDENGKGMPVLRVFAGGKRLAYGNANGSDVFTPQENSNMRRALEEIAPPGRVDIHPAHVVINSDKIGNEQVLQEAFVVTVVRIVADAFGIAMNPEEHGVFTSRSEVRKNSDAYGDRWNLTKF
ncbi:hypothetical protein EON76_02170 [bacterium]|nr:MAG: hypothetical protein EON76_02170 [bacterium]